MAYSCFTCGRIANQRYRRSLSEPIRIVHRFHWQACLSYRHPWSAALVCQQASNQIPAHRTAGPWGFAAFLPFGARGLCKQSFFTQYCFIWILIQLCFVDRRGAGMAQWWEHSSPTNVARVRRREMWVEFVGSLLCTERFSLGNPVSPLHKNQNLTWLC